MNVETMHELELEIIYTVPEEAPWWVEEYEEESPTWWVEVEVTSPKDIYL